MATLKALLFGSLLVIAALAVVPMAVDAQFSGLLGLLRLRGTLYCTANGGVSTAGVSRTPPFANATVQLQCGSGNVVASTTTNSVGVFTILMDPLEILLSSLLSNCKIVVTTPLSNCNSSLPGTALLSSALQLLITTTLAGLFSIIEIIPKGFILLN